MLGTAGTLADGRLLAGVEPGQVRAVGSRSGAHGERKTPREGHGTSKSRGPCWPTQGASKSSLNQLKQRQDFVSAGSVCHSSTFPSLPPCTLLTTL